MYSANRANPEAEQSLLCALRRPPLAVADIHGSPDYPTVRGRAQFYQTTVGALVYVRMFGLPQPDARCPGDIFAFHIHGGGRCAGNGTDAFADVMAHYNPQGCAHPGHAGDLLPLWGAHGRAFAVFLTDRFAVEDIVGKTVLVHRGPDDFTTQPAGGAGEKIACGEIRRDAPRRSPRF